ncbi:MAG: Ig-like domain-containing protein, partial [Acidobacteriales bacterium]|nr:Ig-like domain-containing protein [Terriglobales bacterium]
VGPRSLTITDLAAGISATKVIFVGNLNPNNSVSLSVSAGPAFFRHSSITLNAVVSGAGPTPTGVVRFFEGIKELGSATLAPTGGGSAGATFTTANLPPGDHSVIAVYEGDANYGANFSAAVSKTRSPAPRCVNNVCPGSH